MAVAGLAQAAAVVRVVGVEALLDELPPVERPVVCVLARPLAPGAGGAAAGAAGASAVRVAGEDAGPEPGLVLAAVPALPCAATPALCLAPVLLAPALLGVLGAAWL